MNILREEKFRACLLAGLTKIVEAIVALAVRISGRGMNKASNRIQRLKQLPLDRHSHAMRHITPVGEALHFLAPVLDPLLPSFRCTAFVENRANFDFGSVAPYALHDPG